MTTHKGTHTQGPWTVHDTSDGGLALVEAECLMISVDHREDFGRAKPDALLIAAAPELLEALRDILEIGKRDMSNPKYDGYFDTAWAVVAKAVGGLP